MCLIIAKDRATKLNKSFLLDGIAEAWNPNSHGAGYALRAFGESEIWIDKGYMDKDQFLAKIESTIKEDDDFIIHLRLATSGEQDDVNCHPFVISPEREDIETVEGFTKKAVMAHNGVIYEFSDRSSEYSDTFRFVEYHLSMIIPKYYPRLLGNMGTNKFAVLDPRKGLSVYGNFIREKGIFFSNGGYKKHYSNYNYHGHNVENSYY